MATTPSNSEKDSDRITILVMFHKATFVRKNLDLNFIMMISDAKRLTVVYFLIISQNGELAPSLFVSPPLIFPVNHQFYSLNFHTRFWNNNFCLNPVISLVA
jgi:hypothetical protein